VDTNTMIVVVVGILALVVLVFWLLSRQGGKAKISGPMGFGAEMDSTEPRASAGGASIEDSKAGRHIRAESERGSATVRRSQATKGDITARSGGTGSEEDPKA